MYLIHVRLFAGSHHDSYSTSDPSGEVCLTNEPKSSSRTTNFVPHKIEDHENKGLLSTGISSAGQMFI